MNDLVYGVDIGTRRVAVAGPDYFRAALNLPDPATGKGLFTTPRELQLLGGFIAAVVPPGAILWIERPFMGRPNTNINTAIRLGMSVGAILSRHAGIGNVVDQATWKAEIVGSGSASKPDVTAWLWRADPAEAEACGEDQDLIDATCIRRYGVLASEDRLEIQRGVQRPRRPRRRDVRANQPAHVATTGTRRQKRL